MIKFSTCYHSTNDGGGTVSNLDAKVGLARNAASTRFYMGVTDLTSVAAVKRISNVSRFSISGWMHSMATIGNNQWPDMMRKGQWSGNGWFAFLPTNDYRLAHLCALCVLSLC